MKTDLKSLYDTRFNSDEKRKKDGTWVEICKFICRKWGGINGVVVDIAAGYCDFINQIHASHTAHKFAIDANPDVSEHKNDDVTSICDSVDTITNFHLLQSVILRTSDKAIFAYTISNNICVKTTYHNSFIYFSI